MDTHVITAGDIEVTVAPADGGRIGQITVGGTDLLVGRSDEHREVIAWGAYPMVPWAGRIRHGRFEFEGTTHQLPRNHGDHAMHGVGLHVAWDVTERRADRIRLVLDLPTDERWPFGGRVEQTFTVTSSGVDLHMSVAATDTAFPVSMGWHPWFRKPDRVDVAPESMYRRDEEGIAVDELVDVPDHPWDDCFIVRTPIGADIDGVRLELSATTDHWVIYDEQPHATCIEPQTGPPDAFTIAPRIVDPGASIELSFRIEIVERPSR